MKDSYADVLESYMIAEEAVSNNKFSLMEKFNFKGVHDTLVKFQLGNNSKSTGYNFDAVKREFEKNRDSKTDNEWNNEFNRAAIKDMMIKYKWKLDVDRTVKYFEEKGWKVFNIPEKKIEKKSTVYYLEFDGSKALPNSNIVYPSNKFKTSEDLINNMEKDLKNGLRKILSSKEVNNAFNNLCKEYNNTPRGEEFDDRFRFDGPEKLSVNWLKSQFTVENFEEENNYVIFEVCNGDQEFRIFIGRNILYSLGDYIEKMYTFYITSVTYGDGDEGCLYIDFKL